MKRIQLASAITGVLLLIGCSRSGGPQPSNSTGSNASVEEARAIAKEAYIYGFPMVDSYRVQYAYFVDTSNPEYKAPWNQIKNTPRVFAQTRQSNSQQRRLTQWLHWTCAPADRAHVQVIEKMRFSVQLIDQYTFNFAYLGSRATGNDGGSFLVAGPGWKGSKPDGIKQVIQSETEMVLAVYRTQLFDPSDLDNVKKVQAGYKLETLSEFLKQPAPPPAPKIDFIKALTPAEQRTSLGFFNILNFVLVLSHRPSERI